MWHCMNLVCGPEGRASAVLLRAGEVIEGADLARKRRISARNDKELAKGPARLATALEVDRALDGTDACAPESTPLTVLTGTPVSSDQVLNGPRTGVQATVVSTPGASGSPTTRRSALIGPTSPADAQLDSHLGDP
jgi:DNA-3-methyladenine glycosylase